MNKFVLITLASLCVGGFASTRVEQEFEAFKAKYGKVYASPAEEQLRLNIFKENYFGASVQNKRTTSYTTGVTQFSDLTIQEFKDTYLGLKRPAAPVSNRVLTSSLASSGNSLPDSVNWVDRGAVSEVKNQGHCGSCWAFATTEQIESYAQISSGGAVKELSAQQVTSCAPNDVQCGGSGGCYGSVTQLGFNYLQLFGHMTEEDWPYVSGTTSQTEDCEYDLQSKTPAIGITGFDTLPANDEQAVMKHLAEVGPLAIAVDASVWHSYSGGVFDGCSFDENISINHGVQLVGYGSDFSPMGVYDYWLVRNSWSSAWGEDGYIKLQRTSQCGVNSTPMDGTACVGGPGNDQQVVCGMCGMLLDATYPLGVHKF